MKTQIFKGLSLLVFFSTIFLNAQFTSAKVVLDTDRLRKATNNELNNFEITIQNYLLTTEFSPDAMDIEFNIELHFFLEEMNEKGNEKIFNAQLLAYNGIDQQYFSKGIEFTYYPGQTMFYNIQFESLRSIIDYYAFMIIAGDLDTYDYLGGEPYYKRSEEITLDGKSSSFVRGWDDRRKKTKNLKKNYPLRSAKLQFYFALDLYMNPESKVDDLQNKINEFYNSVLDVDALIGEDKDTQIFLKAHSKEIGAMMKKLKMFEEIQALIDYEPSCSDILTKFLPDNTLTK